MKVIGFIISFDAGKFELYFDYNYRGLAKVYVEKIYKGKTSEKIIIKEGVGKEIEDAVYNTNKMKEEWNL